jgi:hypothetical protein
VFRLPNREKISICLLLVIYLVIRCFYLDTVPRWDAASYWGALMQAVHSTKTVTHVSDFPAMVLKEWNAFGHPSMGYYSLLIAGQLIDFPNQYIINFTNILLAMLSIFCVYKILLWFLPNKHQYPEVLLATAAYAFEPLFFGCSIFLNTDFPVLVFFTAALAALLYGRYGLFAVACLFMIFSKEPGIIFWGTLVGGFGLYVLWYVIQQLRAGRIPSLGEIVPRSHYINGQPLKLWQCLYRIGCLLLPLIAFKLFSMARRGAMWADDAGLKFDSSGWNCFGFNPRVMLNRAGEMFVLDFHWVPTIIACVLVLIGVGRLIERKQIHKGLKHNFVGNDVNAKNNPNMEELHPSLSESTDYSATQHNNLAEEAIKATQTKFIQTPLENRCWGMLPILFSFFCFVVFNISYITYIIPRYVVPVGFFLIMCTVFAMHFAIKSQRIRISILSVMLVLFFAQTFRTIDLLSKLAFGTAPFNQHEILQIDNPGEAVGNGFVYNAEFTAVDKLFNLMNKAMPIKPDTVLIAWNADGWYPWFFNGGVFVDPVKLVRTVDWRNTFHYNIIGLHELQTSPETQPPAEAYYVYMPWLSKFSNEQTELTRLRSLYQIAAATEVGYQGYSLRFYKLTRLY